MSDEHRPEQTVDLAPSEGALDAGLQAAFDGDSGPPLPAGGSVLQALEAAAPGSVRRVHLRQPDDDPPTPVNLPASEQLPPPQDFPQRYQLVGEIARGGMGAVFKGRDVDLGRDIAVKMMLETHKGRTEMLQRFVEEAQIGGQLQHPGIVPVYELSQTRDRRPYFTMKLVKGQTLAVLLKQRPEGQQDLPRFLGIFEQVCRTVAYAHARGVIHRDLKPSNIMVGNFGEIQVMDWGLAKVLASGGCQPPGTGEDRGVTPPARPCAKRRRRGASWERPPTCPRSRRAARSRRWTSAATSSAWAPSSASS
jgi:serine/threonine protein kinase